MILPVVVGIGMAANGKKGENEIRIVLMNFQRMDIYCERILTGKI